MNYLLHAICDGSSTRWSHRLVSPRPSTRLPTTQLIPSSTCNNFIIIFSFSLFFFCWRWRTREVSRRVGVYLISSYWLQRRRSKKKKEKSRLVSLAPDDDEPSWALSYWEVLFLSSFFLVVTVAPWPWDLCAVRRQPAHFLVVRENDAARNQVTSLRCVVPWEKKTKKKRWGNSSVCLYFHEEKKELNVVVVVVVVVILWY